MITIETIRQELDDILKEAEPILELSGLIQHLHKKICFLEQDLKRVWDREPELEYCKNTDCEECTKSPCPQIRQEINNLRWGSNSINTITKLIGDWDMYAFGKKDYKKDD